MPSGLGERLWRRQVMYEIMADLYRRGRVTAEGIHRAVADGVITEKEASAILNPVDSQEE